MAFANILLPPAICLEATGGSLFDTTVVISQSGNEQRNSNWPQDRAKWDIQFVVATDGSNAPSVALWLALRNFFYNRKGRYQGFLFQDWSDYTDEGQGRVTLIDGTYQLVKNYVDSENNVYIKNIVKPGLGTLTGSPPTPASPITFHNLSGTPVVDYTTGIVTGTSESGVDAYNEVKSGATYATWTGSFQKPVRFQEDAPKIVMSQGGKIATVSCPVMEILDFV